MSLSVAGLMAAYVLVTMLLLSLNLTSLWRWWVKAAAIIITTGFFGVTYVAINGLLGWPTTQRLPTRFNLVSSRIIEPDRRTNSPGHIYLWADALDANNVPAETPRSYQLRYSDALARKITGAQEKRDHGLDMMGRVTDDEAPRAEVRRDVKLGRAQNDKGQQSPAKDTVPFKEDGSGISFENLPPVILPDKGPL